MLSSVADMSARHVLHACLSVISHHQGKKRGAAMAPAYAM